MSLTVVMAREPLPTDHTSPSVFLAGPTPRADSIPSWRPDARERASAILFWIPRDLNTLPGFTTNVEFGLDIGTGRAVLGCPPDCPNPDRHGAPVCHTLPDTVTAALTLARNALTTR